MYWQVYLHKTTVSAERMLVNLIRRAQVLVRAGEQLTASDSLTIFLRKETTLNDFRENPATLDDFGQLDDNDIWGAIKSWKNHSDNILSLLSGMMIQRHLFGIRLSAEPIRKNQVEVIRNGVMKHFSLLRSEVPYLFSHGTVSNEAYAEGKEINIMMGNGEVIDIAQASDLPHIKALGKIVKKNYLCWPKNVSL
jgi:HD superfamily phosphohydrolase